MISKHPVIALGTGLIALVALVAASFGAFYATLAVGVSDGPGHITAQIMLAVFSLATLAALLITCRAAWALLA